MITKEQLSTLTSEEKDHLILDQASQIRALEARIGELETRIAQLEALIFGFEEQWNGRCT
jgi:polyhydroxyalkanoate synthesis regulator phasin